MTPADVGRPFVLDIIGCGAAVQQLHVPALRRLARAGSLAVNRCVDLDEANARVTAEAVGAAHWSTGASPDRDPGVDGALIATPPHLHAPLATAQLDAGRHVLVEKPITPELATFDTLIGRARAVGRLVAGNYLRRFYPALRAAREVLAEGIVGRVQRVEASEGFRFDWGVATDYVATHPAGGVLLDTGPHLIDSVLYALSLDEPDASAKFEVGGLEKRPSREPSHDCRFTLDLETPDGATVSVACAVSRVEPLAKVLKFRGERGTLVVPAGFADTLMLVAPDGAAHALRPLSDPIRAGGLTDCFMAAHREFVRAARADDTNGVLGAGRFRLSTAIIERLVDPGASSERAA